MRILAKLALVASVAELLLGCAIETRPNSDASIEIASAAVAKDDGVVAAANDAHRLINERGFSPEQEGAVLAFTRTPVFQTKFAAARMCLDETTLSKLEKGELPADKSNFRQGAEWLVEKAVLICERPFSEFVVANLKISLPRLYAHQLLVKSAVGQVVGVISQRNQRTVDQLQSGIADRLEECRLLLKC